MRHHKRGCPINDQRVIDAVRAGAANRKVNYRHMAKRLGLSVPTIQNIVRRHRIEWASFVNAKLSEASVREALRGRTTLEAAKRLGVTHGTLRNRFPDLIVKRARPLILESHKARIRSLATHMRGNQIAERLGVCGETVRVAIRRWTRKEPDAWSDVTAFQRARRGMKWSKKRSPSNPSGAF
jgi:transposase